MEKYKKNYLLLLFGTKEKNEERVKENMREAKSRSNKTNKSKKVEKWRIKFFYIIIFVYSVLKVD